MLPRVLDQDLSTASQGLVLTRSLPRMWSMVKNGAVISTGGPQVLPPSSERAEPHGVLRRPGNRSPETDGRSCSGPKRGIEPCPSRGVALIPLASAKVGGVAERTSSE